MVVAKIQALKRAHLLKNSVAGSREFDTDATTLHVAIVISHS
jgi:hypothetical protein